MNKRAQQNLIQPLFYIFILVVFVLALFFEGKGINLATNLFTKVLVSLIYSIVVGAIVGLLPLKYLEWFNTSVLGFKFNVAVAILTFIIKVWLF